MSALFCNCIVHSRDTSSQFVFVFVFAFEFVFVCSVLPSHLFYPVALPPAAFRMLLVEPFNSAGHYSSSTEILPSFLSFTIVLLILIAVPPKIGLGAQFVQKGDSQQLKIAKYVNNHFHGR